MKNNKKEIAKIVNDVDALNAIRKQIKNALSEEGADLAAALRGLIDELENSEVTIDEAELRNRIEEVMKATEPSEKIQEFVANAIAKRMTAMQQSMPKELTPEIKNQISAAILHARGKDEVKDAVNAVLVKNDITGLTFENVVDYAIVEKWGDLNPLVAQLKKVPYTKFFYSEQDMSDKEILAKQWTKTSETEKVIQELVANGKTITPKYVYKRQRLAFEDLDNIEKSGEMSNFLRFIDEELDRMIANTIAMAIVIGDTTNDLANRVTTFETIGNKTVTDVFTTVKTRANANVTLTDLRQLADTLYNPKGAKKVLLMAQETISKAAEFTYASGGTTTYMSNEELAAKIGVDEIIPCSLLDPTGNVYAVAMIPDEYWYHEVKSLSVAYPEYSMNAQNYLKERNVGGAIHGLSSTAVLRKTA